MKLIRSAVLIMVIAVVLSLAVGLWSSLALGLRFPYTTELIRHPQVASALRIPLPV